MCMIWYIVVRPPFASNAPIPVPVIKMSLSPVPYLYFQRAPVPYVPSPVPFCLDAVCLSNTFPKCDCYYVQLLNIILSSNQTSISYSTVATLYIFLFVVPMNVSAGFIFNSPLPCLPIQCTVNLPQMKYTRSYGDDEINYTCSCLISNLHKPIMLYLNSVLTI
uniref:Uncharacterized protein n=1 Tax=Cacopsylla melanoneura TaxID=428564 RepID=A0A8D8SP49_9HEMI